MALTHTFEIKINGFNVEGEISFLDDGQTMVKINNSVEMPLEDLKQFGKFLPYIEVMCRDYGTIEKIEIVKVV